MGVLDRILGRKPKAQQYLGNIEGQRTLLLTTTGRRTGLPRKVEVIYTPWGEDWVVIGALDENGRNPAWSTNLIAKPEAFVTLKGITTEVIARLAGGAERTEIWERARRNWPGYDRLAEQSQKQMRVFVLERR